LADLIGEWISLISNSNHSSAASGMHK
jgi:hypothetical protein